VATEKGRTVWFPKDLLLVIALYIALWGFGGFVWGVVMALFTDGQLVKWLIVGFFWGASCWFLMSIFLVIAFRQVAAGIPVKDTECLSDIAKSLRYTIKQDSPASFVGTPKHWLARFFECSKLHIWLYEEKLELTGPALVVNKVRKKL